MASGVVRLKAIQKSEPLDFALRARLYFVADGTASRQGGQKASTKQLREVRF